MPQIKGVPLVLVSASAGEGLDELMAAAMESHAVWNRRVPTAALNRFLSEAVGDHSPPAVKGRPVRLDYMTQPKSRPPTFVLFSSRAAAMPETYRRYLVNGLREAFDLPGTPIRLNASRQGQSVRQAKAPLMDELTGKKIPKAARCGGKRLSRFIFATVLLDMLAVGIIIPVLPKLVFDFVGGNAEETQKYSEFSAPHGR